MTAFRGKSYQDLSLLFILVLLFLNFSFLNVSSKGHVQSARSSGRRRRQSSSSQASQSPPQSPPYSPGTRGAGQTLGPFGDQWDEFVRKWTAMFQSSSRQQSEPIMYALYNENDTRIVDDVYVHRPELIQKLWEDHKIQVFPSPNAFNFANNPTSVLDDFPFFQSYKTITDVTQYIHNFMQKNGLNYQDVHSAVVPMRGSINCDVFPAEANVKDVCFNDETILFDIGEIPPAELFLLKSDDDNTRQQGHCITIGEYIRLMKRTPHPRNPWTREHFQCPIRETNFYTQYKILNSNTPPPGNATTLRQFGWIVTPVTPSQLAEGGLTLSNQVPSTAGSGTYLPYWDFGFT